MKVGQVRKFSRGGKFILLSKRPGDSVSYEMWDVYRFNDQRFFTYRERDLLIGSDLVCEVIDGTQSN